MANILQGLVVSASAMYEAIKAIGVGVVATLGEQPVQVPLLPRSSIRWYDKRLRSTVAATAAPPQE